MSEAPIQEKYRDLMNQVAAGLDDIFNGKNCKAKDRKTGFVLFLFDFNKPPTKGQMNYISNADRLDFLTSLKEMVAHLEGRLGDGSETKHWQA